MTLPPKLLELESAEIKSIVIKGVKFKKDHNQNLIYPAADTDSFAKLLEMNRGTLIFLPGDKESGAEWSEPVTILELIERVRKIEAALAFYADSYTWVSNSGKIGINPIDDDMENIPGSSGAIRYCGGIKARKALGGET